MIIYIEQISRLVHKRRRHGGIFFCKILVHRVHLWVIYSCRKCRFWIHCVHALKRLKYDVFAIVWRRNIHRSVSVTSYGRQLDWSFVFVAYIVTNLYLRLIISSELHMTFIVDVAMHRNLVIDVFYCRKLYWSFVSKARWCFLLREGTP